jgi:flagellar hook-length control protein FliK
MSAPFSTSSLANSLSMRVTSPAASNAVLGITGIGAASDSFSRTLQNQMKAGDTPTARNEPAPSQAPREPERRTSESTREPESRASESAREPERSTSNEAGTNAQGSASKEAGTENRDAERKPGEASDVGKKDDTTKGKDATASAQGGQADARTDAAASVQTSAASDSIDTLVADAGQGSAEAASDVALAALATTAADASAIPPTDPAALAGLPAAIAALLSGRQAPPSGAADTEAPLLATDSKGRSLQNSGLLPKTDVSAEAGGRGASTPAFLLQGRELAAAVIGARGAGAGQALQALQGEPGNNAAQQAGQGLHTHGAMHILRHAPTPQPTMPQLPVHTPAGQQAWAEDVGNQVRWMLGRAESKAELVLTPPNLGKLEVSIHLNGDQTTAQFVASSQAARDALERAMPQLREILQQAGIMLGDANVSTSQQGAGGEGQEGRGNRGGRGEAIAGEAADTGSSTGVWLRQQQGMVDTFA